MRLEARSFAGTGGITGGDRSAEGSGGFYSHFGDGLTDPTRRTWENSILALRSQMRLITMNLWVPLKSLQNELSCGLLISTSCRLLLFSFLFFLLSLYSF